MVAFVGRIQPLKAPDVLLRAAAELRDRDPALADQADRGDLRRPERQSGLDRPTALIDLAAALGIADCVRFLPPRSRGDDLADAATAPPTWSRCRRYNESFGLVALEAQACGTPVVAAAVGGLVTAVRDEVTRRAGRRPRPGRLGRVLGRLLADPAGGRRCPRAPCGTPASSPGTAPSTGLLAVYREAIAEHRRSRPTGRAGARPVTGLMRRRASQVGRDRAASCERRADRASPSGSQTGDRRATW